MQEIKTLKDVDCVDILLGGNIRSTSDDFFKQNLKRYDIIFIDGNHCALQVRKDVLNALMALKSNGIILLHDVFPDNEAFPEPRKMLRWFQDYGATAA
jgi:predicted O-methyltransferase YrrM